MATKHYSLDEFIDLLTQAKTHLERADQVNASLTARQADLASTDAALTEKKTALSAASADFAKEFVRLKALHDSKLQDLSAEMTAKVNAIDAAAKERTETHQREVSKLQQRITQLTADVVALTEQEVRAQASLELVRSVLDKTKAEAKKFSALLS